MPIEFLYTNAEIIQLRFDILIKDVISNEDLILLRQINEYTNKNNKSLNQSILLYS